MWLCLAAIIMVVLDEVELFWAGGCSVVRCYNARGVNTPHCRTFRLWKVVQSWQPASVYLLLKYLVNAACPIGEPSVSSHGPPGGECLNAKARWPRKMLHCSLSSPPGVTLSALIEEKWRPGKRKEIRGGKIIGKRINKGKINNTPKKKTRV